MRKILFTLLLSIALFSYSNAQTYCAAVNGSGGCLTHVVFNTTLNHTSAGCENGPNYYTLVPVGTTTTSITGGQSYSLAVTLDSSDAAILSVWIDYNHNGTFDSTEWNQIATNAQASSTSTINIAVPANAVAGQTGMRIRSRSVGSPNGPNDACTTMYSGETEDYVVTIVAAPACTGTPTAGTISGPASICSGMDFNLSLTGFTSGVSGLTFQWQSSTSMTGTYTNINGETESTYTASQTAAMYYKCVVTCSGSSATSAAYAVDLYPANLCNYCHVTSDFMLDDKITNVTFSTINNTTTCADSGYSWFVATVPDLNRNGNYPISVTVGPGGTEYVSVWIDYNQNGMFDTAEYKYIGSGNDTILTSSITIPSTAVYGNTGMRVRVRYNTMLADTAACYMFSFGETEDYIVNIHNPSAGIEESELLNNVAVFPNPTTGMFNIVATDAKFNEIALNVIDIQGKTVFSSVDKNIASNYNKQVNLEGLAKGIYYIKMSTERGVKVQKLVIQ